MPFAPLPAVFEALRQGKMIVLVDDEKRENEGDLVAAAELVTAETINFMTKEGRGLLCLALTGEACDRLHLPLMVAENQSNFGTAFTVTIEAREGVTTGISAAERAHTIRTAARPDATARDLVRPGHVQPIRARDGGVLVRAGQTEGSVDLMRLAGLTPAAVICEILNPDGTMARLPELEVFCARHGLLLTSVEQIIEYRRRTEKLIRHVATVHLPTDTGNFRLHCYECTVSHDLHLALTVGDLYPGREPILEPVLLRVHSECMTGDIFHSRRCDCGAQLHLAMERVQQEKRGAVIYMRQEGRGIGLENKLRAYALQEKGLDTVEANLQLGFAPDLRDYGLGAQIVSDLGIRKMRLLTNNPRKIVGLAAYGLEVVERIPLISPPTPENLSYLQTKRTKLGHLFEVDLAECQKEEGHGTNP